jgi:hypothetical protein
MGVLVCNLAWAGAPFVTDDPETPPFKHFEIYLSANYIDDLMGGHGGFPSLEINYGCLPQTECHMLMVNTFLYPPGKPVRFGYGDTELGIKHILLEETDKVVQEIQNKYPGKQVETVNGGAALL